jgi:microcystin-dependent protein
MASDPYVGELMIFCGNFAPAGWMTCDGQLLPIDQYETLFELIGTTYGGDGESTFALPNLNGRVPIDMGNNGTSNYTIGETGGVAEVQLTSNQIPSHNHTIIADANPGNLGGPTNAYPANAAPTKLYGGNASPLARTMNAAMLPNAGGSQPHDNMQPYLAVNYCISLFGVYPSPT